MRRQARQLVVQALSGEAVHEAERRARLQEAQRICYSPEVQQLLVAMEVSA
jgi:hypothetical protein